MRRFALAALVIGAVSATAAAPAEARWRGGGWNGGGWHGGGRGDWHGGWRGPGIGFGVAAGALAIGAADITVRNIMEPGKAPSAQRADFFQQVNRCECRN